jgi:hypothetical protein
MSEERETRGATRGVIWRYDLADQAILRMPAGARVLNVGWESSGARIWIMADPELPKLERRVKMISTGGELDPERWDFAGTVIAPGALVWHVFLEVV